MKVIFLQNIKGTAQIGDIKNVSDGYARNFLFPKNIAKLATDRTIKEVESLKKKVAQAQEVEKGNAFKIAEKLKDLALEFKKKASKMGKLYSSVTKGEIAEKLSKLSGFQIEAKMINIAEQGEHIKQTGEYFIEVELSPTLKSQVKIQVY